MTTSDGSLLRGVRATLSGADRAMLCVAFVHERGLHLLRPELEQLQARGRAPRLLVTTTFDATRGSALALAHQLGVEVRVLNPGGSSYHPKLYLGSRGSRAHAVIGSANLTAGLANNLEVAIHLRGEKQETAIEHAWSWAESLWADRRAVPWSPTLVAEAQVEPFAADLFPLLSAEVSREPVFQTLGPRPARNEVLTLTPAELFVQTSRSRASGRHGEPIPAWMFNLAWDHLKTHGVLSNRELLEDLRVHRSSAVCAILARIPGISVGPPGITLRRGPRVHS